MYRGKKKTANKVTDPIPTTLDEFGYIIKDDGSVRSKTTDLPYVYEYDKKDIDYNEARYRVFMDLIGDVIEERLQQEPLLFQKVTVPKEADPTKNEPHTYVYMTPNALTTTGNLLLFIAGTCTRIGQWSKRVLNEENIQGGSVIEMALEARKNGVEMIIFNPNGNLWYDNASHDMIPKKKVYEYVPENESPEKHCRYIYNHFIRQSKAEKINVVASGHGGICFIDLLNNYYDELKSRVTGVVIAHSYHTKNMVDEDKHTWVFNHVVNWAESEKPKGSTIMDQTLGCVSFSAEEPLTEKVIWKCSKEIMKFVGIKFGYLVPEEDSDISDDDDNLEEDERAELAEHLDIVSIG